MEGYYDHHPLLQLPKPLVLAGFPGSQFRKVAYVVASRTGLSFSDLDRWVEHEAGSSLWDLVAQRGEGAYREMAGRLLERALRSKPATVIALGDTTLLEPQNLEAVLSSSTFVHVRLDLAGAYWQIRRHEETHGRGWNPFVPSPVSEIEDLRPLYRRLEPALRRAHLTLEASGRHASELAVELVETLGAGS